MLREFYVISASLANVQTSIGCPPSKMHGWLCYLLLESAVFWYHVLGHCGWIETVSFGSCNLLRREERGSWHILALVFDGFLLPLTPGHPVQPWNVSESECNAHFDDFFRVLWRSPICGNGLVEPYGGIGQIRLRSIRAHLLGRGATARASAPTSATVENPSCGRAAKPRLRGAGRLLLPFPLSPSPTEFFLTAVTNGAEPMKKPSDHVGTTHIYRLNLWTKPFSKPLRAGFSFKKLHQAPFTLYEPMWKMVKASYLHCIIILFYMSYLQMVNRTCSKPKLLKEAVFSPPIWTNFIKIRFNYKCEYYLYKKRVVLSASWMQAATKWSQQRSAKARDPQVLCSWGPLPSLSCTPSDATSTRSFTTSTWPKKAATCNGVQPQAAHAAETLFAEVEKESQPKPVGIERSSPDGHRPQRPRAIVLLQVHLRLGREKQPDHPLAADACRTVQRGFASVRSPACGCASTPTKLGNKLLESMFVTRPF